MNATVEQNNLKNFPKNEGKINSKGMVAPPVPTRSPETKLSSQSELQISNKTTKPKAEILAEQQRKLSVQEKVKLFEGASKKSNVETTPELEITKVLRTLSRKQKKILGFYPKQSDGKKVQNQLLSEKDTFPEPPECAYKPALFPKPSKEKINESLGKNSYLAQSTGRNPALDWNPIYQGKKRFSSNNMSSSSSSCSEKSNISDISDKSNNSNIVRCNITRSNSKEDLRKPDASHNDKSAGKKLSDVNVSELIRKFEQDNYIVKGCLFKIVYPL